MDNVRVRKFEWIGGSLQPTVFINVATQTEFDTDGYNYLNFDKDGYDRNGYDKEGYGRDGYSKNGWNKNWRNRDGIYYFTGTKYDKEGFDIHGINQRGFDRSGIHSVTGTKRDLDGYDINDKDENGISRKDKQRLQILESENMNEEQCPYCAGEGYVDARDGAINGRRVTNRKICNKCLGTGKKGRSPYL